MAHALTTGDLLGNRLRPMALRLRMQDALLLASRTLWIALLGGVLILLAGRLTPIPNLWALALAPVAVWLLAMLFTMLRPLPIMQAARRVDSALDLRERLATALELRGLAEHGPLDQLQSQDALAVSDALNPRLLPLRVDRQALLIALAPLVAIVALVALPNPQDTVLQQQAAVRAAAEQTANEVQQLAEQIQADQRLSPEQQAQILQQLAELEQRLRDNPGNREQALADLSEAEAQLQQQIDPNADAQRAALEQMARNLDQLAGRDPSSRPSLDQAAQNLAQLAEQLAQMTPEERQRVADELNRQAQQLQQTSPQTAQNLQQAAQAIQQGDIN